MEYNSTPNWEDFMRFHCIICQRDVTVDNGWCDNCEVQNYIAQSRHDLLINEEDPM